MENFEFPFPDKALAQQELAYDFCYAKIPPIDRERIVEMAWEKGVDAAKQIFKEQKGNSDFFAIAKSSGLAIIEKDMDYIAGGQRYFSDYVSGQSVIHLYLGSIQLWAEQNGLNLKTAEMLILSHEYFHFLECTRLGLTSRLYQVPAIRCGPLRVGKVGIRALSEIGAHAFARTYYELLKEGTNQ